MKVVGLLGRTAEKRQKAQAYTKIDLKVHDLPPSSVCVNLNFLKGIVFNYLQNNRYSYQCYLVKVFSYEEMRSE